VLERVWSVAGGGWDAAQDFAGSLFSATTVRLGVTGLARAGKTVFITALVHHLLTRGRLPFFDAAAQGRLARVYLEPQPDDVVPRFDYEAHLAALTADEPRWPESTRQVSELRLTFEYMPLSMWRGALGPSRLHLDIVDYPGEWLLDLPLLDMSYGAWSRGALALARDRSRAEAAAPFLAFVASLGSKAQDEQAARQGAALFKSYLSECRAEPRALSSLPPGRFLMPGDLDGSPALTFFPLDPPEDNRSPPRDSLHAMLARRYESYKLHVVRPFFREHFARLDRQIVLADVLTALNAGPDAVADLQRAITDILACFRHGQNTWLTALVGRRIDRIVFAATKADHLHQAGHDRLEAILRLITSRSMERAAFSGAELRSVALAAVRATREGEVTRGGETLPCIIGTPIAGEKLGTRVFDGAEELAVFPGDLPTDPRLALSPDWQPDPTARAAQFVRFRPPKPSQRGFAPGPLLPHVRLDSALNFLVGDKLT
jgi:hypothetical protein